MYEEVYYHLDISENCFVFLGNSECFVRRCKNSMSEWKIGSRLQVLLTNWLLARWSSFFTICRACLNL
uniref:Putative ovule protein n=1 Tax=Solanum chacoense TaxID=4108 RepID=A0A0V0HKV6_SOLCH